MKFTAEFLEQRLREHRRRQQAELKRLCIEVIDEVLFEFPVPAHNYSRTLDFPDPTRKAVN